MLIVIQKTLIVSRGGDGRFELEVSVMVFISCHVKT